MASHLRDSLLHGGDHLDTHASDSRWRHQEGHSYANHARNASRSQERSRVPSSSRPSIDTNEDELTRTDEDEELTLAQQRQARKIQSVSSDLADFLNNSRMEPPGDRVGKGGHTPIFVKGSHGGEFAEGLAARSSNGYLLQKEAAASMGVGLGWEVKCGPLLNYRGMEEEVWHGSVLIVIKTTDMGNRVPVLELKRAKNGNNSSPNGDSNGIRPSVSHAGSGSDDNFATPRTTSSLAGFETSQAESNGHGETLDIKNPQSTGNDHLNAESTSADNNLGGLALNAGVKGTSIGDTNPNEALTKVEGTKLYSDSQNTFFRFEISVPMLPAEQKISYTISDLHFPIDVKKTGSQHFYVPAKTESMRIMFHSCNGFSVGTDEDAWSGACLWNDVLRVHEKTPFHVMLGGGDQIYNDGIRVHGPLRKWTDVKNPLKRREYPFPESLRIECDDYYVKNYTQWYSTEPFASANGQIPQLNLWDDHDIIDGFGSYVSEFMQCPVFRGIGGVAYKYYMLFQHHLAPPKSSYTSDSPQTGPNGAAANPKQPPDTFVHDEKNEEPGYIIGARPGPYVAERSRSIYARLGARIAFFGIDARTERTRHQVNYPDTYDLIFARLRKELAAAASSPSPIQHLVVVLGIPIAYPRLTWLENIFTSPIMGPIKFLNKRFGLAGGLFNHFDGSVDLLDDLDDHYTAKAHKKERHMIVKRFQALAAEFSVRISILSGDVHLAAVGRFYSNPKLNIPIDADHRYIVNVVSSAIVNKPPPAAIANLLWSRNKIHHLDGKTDETLLNMFDKDPTSIAKTAYSNHVTMPSRNWAMITENSPNNALSHTSESSNANGAATTSIPDPALIPNRSTNGYLTVNGHNTTRPTTASTNGFSNIKKTSTASNRNANATISRSGTSSSNSLFKDGHYPLGPGEEGAGTMHRAAGDDNGRAGDGSLDVVIRVEIDQHDSNGKTMGYGMQIPTLRYNKSESMKTTREILAEGKHEGGNNDAVVVMGGINQTEPSTNANEGYVNGNNEVSAVPITDLERHEKADETSAAGEGAVLKKYSTHGTQTTPPRSKG